MSKEDNREFYAEVKSFKNRKMPRKVLHMIDGELTEPKQKARQKPSPLLTTKKRVE